LLKSFIESFSTHQIKKHTTSARESW
jgi:hypothetical protein